MFDCDELCQKLDSLTSAEGSWQLWPETVNKSDWLKAVTSKFDSWQQAGSEFRYANLMRYLHKPSTPDGLKEPKFLPMGIADCAVILSLVIGVNIVDTEALRARPESDEEIMQRIVLEYCADAPKGNRVCPRNGAQYQLERLNWHERDGSIVFDEKEHVYFHLEDGFCTQKAMRFDGSVSSIYSRFFSKFDAHEVARKNYTKWRTQEKDTGYKTLATQLHRCGFQEEEEELRVVGDVLKYMWGVKNATEKAAEKGTCLRLAIERHLNGIALESEEIQSILQLDGETTLELDVYRRFLNEVVEAEGLEAYRTEWSVWDSRHMACGQIDSVFLHRATGQLHMIDWKRSKKNLRPDPNRSFPKWGSGPCAKVEDTAFPLT